MLASAAIVSLVGCTAPDREIRGAGHDLGSAFARADSVVAAWVADERVAGAVLSLSGPDGWRDVRAHGHARSWEYGGGLYPGGSGIVRSARPVPMTTETVFDLASVTKVVATTMAVMLLADRGRVEVDAPASRYVPDFTGGGRDAVTVRELLTHRSGLPAWQPVYYHAADAEATWAYVRSRPLDRAPGAERRYSDLGFMVLGRLVREVSGRRLDVFLRDELYEPLGLASTHFRPVAQGPSGTGSGPDNPSGTNDPDGLDGAIAATSHGNPFERRMVHDPDFGYRIDGDPDAWDGWRRYTLSGEVNDGNAFHAFGGVAGHAGLFSTAADLDVLLRLLLDGGVGADGRRMLEEATVRAFLASTGEDQALGWQLPAWAPAGAFGHTGFTGTFVLGMPERGLALVLLTNRQHGGVDGNTQYPDLGPLQRSVVEALLVGPP